MAVQRHINDHAVSNRRQALRQRPRAQPSLAFLVAVPLLAGLASCTGTVADKTGGETSSNDSPDTSNPSNSNTGPTAPGGSADCKRPLLDAGLRRLSRQEYLNTVRDLFVGLDVGSFTVTRDQNTLGFENRAKNLYATDTNVSDFNAAAAAIASQAVKSLDKLLPGCTASDAQCGAKFIEGFGKRAFRRPLTDEEKQRYTQFVTTQTANLSFPQAIALAVEGMLQSANFLYRPELSGKANNGVVRVSGYEMASRLSYFIWGSMPDDQLFAAAERGLATDDDVQEQAKRMLADDRAKAQMIDFHRQWLDYDHVVDTFQKEGAKDPTLYPGYGKALVASMRQESDLFTGKVMFDGTHTLKELFTSRVTMVDANLAKLYGVTAPASGWAEATLPENQRSGLLTRAAFLAGRAHKIGGSPPLRAVFIMGHIMGQEPPPPPPTANTSEPKNAGNAVKTNRQLFEDRVHEQTSCPACHETIDNIGFTFENYDAIGNYRDKDNGMPVDSTGKVTLDDKDFALSNARDLSVQLSTSPQVLRIMTENWFQFAVARDKVDSDDCAVDGLLKNLTDADGDVRSLQAAIIKAADFVYRPAL